MAYIERVSSDDLYYDDSTYAILDQIDIRAGTLGTLFERVASILMFITLVELGIGFLFAFVGTHTTLHRVLRYVSFAAAVVLLAVAVAWFAKINLAWSAYYDSDESGSLAIRNLNSSLKVARQLDGAFDILGWLLSMPLVILGAAVLRKYMWKPVIKGVRPSNMLASVTILLPVDADA